jgi:hypothetical protein
LRGSDRDDAPAGARSDMPFGDQGHRSLDQSTSRKLKVNNQVPMVFLRFHGAGFRGAWSPAGRCWRELASDSHGRLKIESHFGQPGESCPKRSWLAPPKRPSLASSLVRFTAAADHFRIAPNTGRRHGAHLFTPISIRNSPHFQQYPLTIPKFASSRVLYCKRHV